MGNYNIWFARFFHILQYSLEKFLQLSYPHWASTLLRCQGSKHIGSRGMSWNIPNCIFTRSLWCISTILNHMIAVFAVQTSTSSSLGTWSKSKYGLHVNC